VKDLKSRLAAFQKDGKPTPNTFETLRDFFERTADYWLNAALEIAKVKGSVDTDPKSLRRDGDNLHSPSFEFFFEF
jgi:hypothetical protein